VTHTITGRRLSSHSKQPTAGATGSTEVTVEGHHRATFILEGRSTAERRFKREAEAIRLSDPADSVTLEWIYIPFYFMFGHSALRIGNTLYEFGQNGWRVHPSARAFLFNNPLFKRRFARFRKWGMSPFSFGIPLVVPKCVAARLGEIIADEMRASQAGAFSLFTNNCNQQLLRALRKAGVGIEFKGFTAFSSLSAFRRFLFDSPVKIGTPSLYPLPHHAWMAGRYHMHVPSHIYSNDSFLHKGKRSLWVVLSYVASSLLMLTQKFAWSESPSRGKASTVGGFRDDVIAKHFRPNRSASVGLECEGGGLRICEVVEILKERLHVTDVRRERSYWGSAHYLHTAEFGTVRVEPARFHRLCNALEDAGANSVLNGFPLLAGLIHYLERHITLFEIVTQPMSVTELERFAPVLDLLGLSGMKGSGWLRPVSTQINVGIDVSDVQLMRRLLCNYYGNHAAIRHELRPHRVRFKYIRPIHPTFLRKLNDASWIPDRAELSEWYQRYSRWKKSSIELSYALPPSETNQTNWGRVIGRGPYPSRPAVEFREANAFVSTTLDAHRASRQVIYEIRFAVAMVEAARSESAIRHGSLRVASGRMSEVPAMVIRQADASDLPTVLDTLDCCVNWLNATGINQWDKRYPAPGTFAQDIASGQLFLADALGVVAATVVVNAQFDREYSEIKWWYRNACAVHRLMVRPEFHGRGIARMMMEYAEEEARRLGYESIRLDAFAGNRIALRLYESLGYSSIGAIRLRKGYFICYEKALVSL
jgi:GNAT superfamily N-acetyltransferase